MPLELVLFIHLILESEIIGDHGDEFGICGLASVVLNCVAEVGIEGIDVAAIPRDLDGVADSSLDAARGGLILLCDARVENFRNAVDYVAVVDREENCGAEILIALDMRGHSDLMYYFRDLRLHIGRLFGLLLGQILAVARACERGYVLAEALDVVGLEQAEVRARVCRLDKDALL